MTLRPVRPDDYAEPLASMIASGQIEPPDELVIEDRPTPGPVLDDAGSRSSEPGREAALNQEDAGGRGTDG